VSNSPWVSFSAWRKQNPSRWYSETRNRRDSLRAWTAEKLEAVHFQNKLEVHLVKP